MKGHMLILSANFDEQQFDAKNYNAPIPLADIQKAVGGDIETVPLFSCMMYEGEEVAGVAFCNEEGKLNGLPINDFANSVWLAAAQRENGDESLTLNDIGDRLVGDVAFVWGDDEFMNEL